MQLLSQQDGGYVVDLTPVGGAWVDRIERELSGRVRLDPFAARDRRG
jgi:hypothetical protein